MARTYACGHCEAKVVCSLQRIENGVQVTATVEPVWDDEHVLEVNFGVYSKADFHDNLKAFLVHWPQPRRAS